ncbi:MAG: SIMPL domain-containing protein [Treponemataceae bacterium]
MKKIIFYVLFTCSIMVAFSFSKTDAKTISVAGIGAVKVDPDRATINLAVITRSDSVTKATSENAEKMTKVQKVIQQMGIGKDSFSTGNFNLFQEMDYQNGKSEPGLYRVSNDLMIVIKNIATVGDIIDAAVNAGANQLSSLVFSASDTSEAIKLARIEAIKQAEENARTLVEAAGGKLGKVLSIQETSPMQQPRFANAKFFSNQEVAYDSATPINPGSSDIRVTVSVMFEIL